MPRYIVKIKEYYLEWSTIVDAPVTYGMSLDEFKVYYRNEYGKQMEKYLPDRLKRVETNGTSAHHYSSLEDLIGFNRAGDDEKSLTLDEIYQKYCLQGE